MILNNDKRSVEPWAHAIIKSLLIAFLEKAEITALLYKWTIPHMLFS